MDKQRPCVEALNQGLSDSFTMYFRAHACHWNVEGPDFHEYHAFFAAIASDIYGSIDMWAENIRTLKALAPRSLAEVGMSSRIEDVAFSTDPLDMCIALYEANEIVIEAIDVAFQIATDINEQGIADFLAGRDAAHKKWRWQLNAITGLGNKVEDVEPLPESPMPEEMPEEIGFAEDMIFFGDRAEAALTERIERYNGKAPAALKASAETVRAVYRRGALTAAAGTSRSDAGLERVDAFLRLMTAGRPSNPLYTMDYDLLPASHKRSTAKEEALTASAATSELSMPTLDDSMKPEDYVLALTELSGLGYDAEPAFRASWLRGVDAGNPRERAFNLAIKKYESEDADLLPKI